MNSISCSSILETARYPEIVFRPSQVTGPLAGTGVSQLQIHAIFSIRGSEHELTIPAGVRATPAGYELTSRFVIPYGAWGIRNPSTFLLRVGDKVERNVRASLLHR